MVAERREGTEVNEAVHVHVASRDGKGHIEEYDDVMVAERGEGEVVEYGPYESVHGERNVDTTPNEAYARIMSRGSVEALDRLYEQLHNKHG